MTRIIWRGRCEHVDLRVPADGDRPTPPLAHCRNCGGRELTWTRWEVTTRVGYVAEIHGFCGLDRPDGWRWVDENGNDRAVGEQRRGAESTGDARPFLHPTQASAKRAIARFSGWETKRVRRVTVRTLRRVK